MPRTRGASLYHTMLIVFFRLLVCFNRFSQRVKNRNFRKGHISIMSTSSNPVTTIIINEADESVVCQTFEDELFVGTRKIASIPSLYVLEQGDKKLLLPVLTNRNKRLLTFIPLYDVSFGNAAFKRDSVYRISNPVDQDTNDIREKIYKYMSPMTSSNTQHVKHDGGTNQFINGVGYKFCFSPEVSVFKRDRDVLMTDFISAGLDYCFEILKNQYPELIND